MYEIMYYAGMILAIICFIASVVLFIRNKVWKLIGDVTGWNAKKAIKRLNQKGAEDTSKTEAIKPETSKILVHKATTTGTLQAMPELEESERLKRSAKSKKKKQRNLRMRKEEGTALLQQESANANSVFEVEEDMVVLAGAANKNRVSQEGTQENYTTVLTQEGTEPDRLEEDDVTTKLYGQEDAAGDFKDASTELFFTDTEADELLADEATELLVTDQDEATELLVGEGDEATTLLTREGDEETTLLTREGDGETTLLAREGDEATTLLTREDDEDTTILVQEGTERIEAEFTQFEPVLQEDDELMALLQNAVRKE